MEKRSSTEPRLMAEMMPTGRPATIHSRAAPTVSEIVAGRRSLIRLSTEAPV